MTTDTVKVQHLTVGDDNKVPAEFVCPISLSIMSQLLMTRTGKSFERQAILSWIERSGTCPLTRNPLRPSDLLPNHALAARIQEWRRQRQQQEHQTNQVDDETVSHPKISVEDDMMEEPPVVSCDYSFKGYFSVPEKDNLEDFVRRMQKHSNKVVEAQRTPRPTETASRKRSTQQQKRKFLSRLIKRGSSRYRRLTTFHATGW